MWLGALNPMQTKKGRNATAEPFTRAPSKKRMAEPLHKARKRGKPRNHTKKVVNEKWWSEGDQGNLEVRRKIIKELDGNNLATGIDRN